MHAMRPVQLWCDLVASVRTFRRFAVNMLFKTAALAAASLGFLVAEPATAVPTVGAVRSAEVNTGVDTWEHARRYRHRHSSGRRYYSCRRGSGTTGLIVGGAAGALVGRSVDRGRYRTTGTVLGAAGGALLGREIQRTRRCR
jgi:uncharacterized protein YcfJ